MSILNTINQYNNKVLYNYDSEAERTYCNLKDLFEGNGSGVAYPIEALFINEKSKFGNSPVIVSGSYLVNAPSHLLETVEAMRKDEVLTQHINDRKVGFTVYEYENQYGIRYSLNWVEIK